MPRHPKRKPLSRGASNAFTAARMGQEPTFTEGEPISAVQYSNVLTWYGIMCETKDARSYLNTWLKESGHGKLVSGLRNVPDQWIPRTAGWICRLKSRGVRLPPFERPIPFILGRVREAIEHAKNPEQTVDRPGVRELSNEKLSRIVGDLEGALDDQTNMDVPKFLRENRVNAQHAKFIADRFARYADEIRQALLGRGADPQIREGYRNWSKADLQEHLGRLESYTHAAVALMSDVKRVRKVRARKPASAERKARGFRYKTSSNVLGATSLPPSSVVGRTEVWLYNSKYRILTVLRTAKGDTLDVKGNRIIHHDPKLSVSKRLRENKVEGAIREVNEGSRKVLADLMRLITTKPCGLQWRGNAEQLILRVT